jgi:endonuclease/exonuclease/phosphatase family metal-dependent hydrolase
MTAPGLSVATYNIHKGFSQFNRRLTVHELRDRLRELDADLVFLQEVQGEHRAHAERHADWPASPQHEFLAEAVWGNSAYGRNVAYDHGHHGNAILSRHPLADSHNQDVTDLLFERRGLLHTQLQLPALDPPVHCVCVHLSLLGRSRRRQLDALAERLDHWAPGASPLIVAGDFNDWRNHADPQFARRLGLTEVFGGAAGRPVRSFPAALPLFRLDRIYVRGFSVSSATVHCGRPWSRLSDHAALTARLQPLPR